MTKRAVSPEEALERAREKRRRYYYRNRDKAVAAAKAYREANPEKVKEAKKAAYLANREKNIAYAAQWRAANPDRVKEQTRRVDPETQRARCRAWKRANRDKCREYSRRALSTPHGQLRNRVRARVRECLRTGWAGGKTFESLGYTLTELKAHLERQFLPGMSWENMGKWHIDHIVPLSSFDIESVDHPDFRRAWGLANLRPLWARENMSKSAKRLTLL